MVEANEVFKQTGLPEYTYVERMTDRIFQTALKTGGAHIYLYGKSKSGKTSMWKNYLSSTDHIEIKITTNMTLNSFYSELLTCLDPFYLKEYAETNGSESKVGISVVAKIKRLFHIGGSFENVDSSSKDAQYTRVCAPKMDLTFVCSKAKESKKVIILEDFHRASKKFVCELADVLKAFADDQIKVIIVGIEDKTVEIINARNDIRGRINTINLDTFKKEELYEILKKGESTLNIELSDEVKQLIVENSYERAYILQGICRYLCENESIKAKMKSTKVISDPDIVKSACKVFAESEKGTYHSTFLKIYCAATKRNKYDTYKWILRALREEREFGEDGIEAKTIAGKINSLMGGGFNTSSIYPCLTNMTNNKQDVDIFRYDDMHLYVDDVMFIFYLKWSDTVREKLVTEFE